MDGRFSQLVINGLDIGDQSPKMDFFGSCDCSMGVSKVIQGRSLFKTRPLGIFKIGIWKCGVFCSVFSWKLRLCPISIWCRYIWSIFWSKPLRWPSYRNNDMRFPWLAINSKIGTVIKGITSRLHDPGFRIPPSLEVRKASLPHFEGLKPNLSPSLLFNGPNDYWASTWISSQVHRWSICSWINESSNVRLVIGLFMSTNLIKWVQMFFIQKKKFKSIFSNRSITSLLIFWVGGVGSEDWGMNLKFVSIRNFYMDIHRLKCLQYNTSNTYHLISV